jgi:hypothetical protein
MPGPETNGILTAEAEKTVSTAKLFGGVAVGAILVTISVLSFFGMIRKPDAMAQPAQLETKATTVPTGLATALQVEQLSQEVAGLRADARETLKRVQAIEIEQARQQGARDAVLREHGR